MTTPEPTSDLHEWVTVDDLREALRVNGVTDDELDALAFVIDACADDANALVGVVVPSSNPGVGQHVTNAVRAILTTACVRWITQPPGLSTASAGPFQAQWTPQTSGYGHLWPSEARMMRRAFAIVTVGTLVPADDWAEPDPTAGERGWTTCENAPKALAGHTIRALVPRGPDAAVDALAHARDLRKRRHIALWDSRP